LIPLEQIQKYKHIVIECDDNTFPQASILYSLMLVLHKKVSLFSMEKVERFSFLAWSDKIRLNLPSSGEYSINAEIDIVKLYIFFKENGLKINSKMATAFYAAYLKRYDNLLSSECNGTVFANLSELIEYGADHNLALKELTQKVPLSTFRLKSIVYKKLLLQNNASKAYVSLEDKDFKESGAQWDDVFEIAKEILTLVHIQEVFIVQSDKNDNIININKEV